ncbi:MAG: hypothetical protein ACYCYK_10075 [Candidatus Dormibacteria bacterium]
MASYIALCVLVAMAVLVTIYLLGMTLPGNLQGFRVALGMRPS